MDRLRTVGSRSFSAASHASIVFPRIMAGRSAGSTSASPFSCSRTFMPRSHGVIPAQRRIVLKRVIWSLSRIDHTSMAHAATSENAVDVETDCPLPDIFARPNVRANYKSALSRRL
jgi:hypothetical protein